MQAINRKRQWKRVHTVSIRQVDGLMQLWSVEVVLMSCRPSSLTVTAGVRRCATCITVIDSRHRVIHSRWRRTLMAAANNWTPMLNVRCEVIGGWRTAVSAWTSNWTLAVTAYSTLTQFKCRPVSNTHTKTNFAWKKINEIQLNRSSYFISQTHNYSSRASHEVQPYRWICPSPKMVECMMLKGIFF